MKRQDHINQGYRNAQKASAAAEEGKTDVAVAYLAQAAMQLFVIMRGDEMANEKKSNDYWSGGEGMGGP